ncbi:hypothetical protein ACQUWT_25695 [Ralstonia pseudosolanacearum]|uniref:hypothetical protein n=1 Tax=Ralstonia pseudosolanacearum TaxID=1310165 RepID=UPI003D17A433
MAVIWFLLLAKVTLKSTLNFPALMMRLPLMLNSQPTFFISPTFCQSNRLKPDEVGMPLPLIKRSVVYWR